MCEVQGHEQLLYKAALEEIGLWWVLMSYINIVIFNLHI